MLTPKAFSIRNAISAVSEDFSFTRSERPVAIQIVLKMVEALHEGDLRDIKGLQNKLQAVESEADDVLTEFVATLYAPGFPSLKAVILKELSALLEKVIDRCRDAGNVVL